MTLLLTWKQIFKILHLVPICRTPTRFNNLKISDITNNTLHNYLHYKFHIVLDTIKSAKQAQLQIQPLPVENGPESLVLS